MSEKIKQLCLGSYVLEVRIQQLECLPAQSTNQLHIHFSHTRISNDLGILLRRPLMSMPQTEKNPFNVGL